MGTPEIPKAWEKQQETFEALDKENQQEKVARAEEEAHETHEIITRKIAEAKAEGKEASAQKLAIQGELLVAVETALLTEEDIGKSVRKIVREHNISKKDFEGMLRDILAEKLLAGRYEDAEQIDKTLNIPGTVLGPAQEQAMERAFSHDLTERAVDLMGRYFIWRKKDTELSDEIKKIAREKVFTFLKEGRRGSAEYLDKECKLDITPQEIIEHAEGLQTFLSNLAAYSPELVDQAKRSKKVTFMLATHAEDPEKLMDLFVSHPFLRRAITENPRFAPYLALTWHQRDNTSHENVSFLFDAQENIRTEHPDLDANSAEFRALMQEKLLGFKKNGRIMKAAEKSGVDTATWLSWDKQRRFTLDKEKETLTTTGVMTAPVLRICELIDIISAKAKETLGKYRKELSAYRVPTLGDTSVLKLKIVKMEKELEKAQELGNAQKAEGIAKGVESLKKKMERPKTVALWDKMMNDMVAYEQSGDEMRREQERAWKLEIQLEEAAKKQNAEEVAKNKGELGNALERFELAYRTLLRRVRGFNLKLEDTLTSVFGKEKAKKIRMEFAEKIAEADHDGTDHMHALDAFFAQNDKEKSELDRRVVSVAVWGRNPDKDLYQGNYTSCCISIESGHGGKNESASTIADYATDLGMQVINIIDEANGDPIVAAWCWLGEDQEKSPTLVVDNIEANEKYSKYFPDQLGTELLIFLKEYGEAIGVKKVVLGSRNNDLPSATTLGALPMEKSDFTKLGGENRSGGYFLEAQSTGNEKEKEKKMPYTLWEFEEKE